VAEVLKPERVVEDFLGEAKKKFVSIEFPKSFRFGQSGQELKEEHVEQG
tara:strand:- start:136 stop:282 length:147 start_codon:yes stop_codon:yes gene_type:complete